MSPKASAEQNELAEYVLIELMNPRVFEQVCERNAGRFHRRIVCLLRHISHHR
jgi:hypothetical protein